MGSENDQQILQHLFQDGYSQFHYQENSTGRGFGLGFILEEAQRLGGTAELHSKPGSGTLLSVTVPEKLPPNMES
jgi:chemotaxis protein histidine kinase CheA